MVADPHESEGAADFDAEFIRSCHDPAGTEIIDADDAIHRRLLTVEKVKSLSPFFDRESGVHDPLLGMADPILRERAGKALLETDEAAKSSQRITAGEKSGIAAADIDEMLSSDLTQHKGIAANVCPFVSGRAVIEGHDSRAAGLVQQLECGIALLRATDEQAAGAKANHLADCRSFPLGIPLMIRDDDLVSQRTGSGLGDLRHATIYRIRNIIENKADQLALAFAEIAGRDIAHVIHATGDAEDFLASHLADALLTRENHRHGSMRYACFTGDVLDGYFLHGSVGKCSVVNSLSISPILGENIRLTILRYTCYQTADEFESGGLCGGLSHRPIFPPGSF